MAVTVNRNDAEKPKGAIPSISTIWFVRSKNEEMFSLHELGPFDMYPKSFPGASHIEQKRRFVLVEISDGKEKKKVIRLGSFHGDNGSHLALAANIEKDVAAIDPHAEVTKKGGGFIYLDQEKRKIYVECRSTRIGAANVDEVADFLREALEKDYKGYQLIVWRGAVPDVFIEEGPKKIIEL